MRIADLVQQSYAISVSKGWHERPLIVDGVPDPDRIAAKLALIHSEIGEMYECHQHEDEPWPWKPISDPWPHRSRLARDPNNEPEGLVVEAADVVIRVGDLCGALGLDLADVLDVEHVDDLSSDDFTDDLQEQFNLLRSIVDKALEALRTDGVGNTFLAPLGTLLCECAELCKDLGLNLTEAIEVKMAYNETRPHRHGGKTL